MLGLGRPAVRQLLGYAAQRTGEPPPLQVGVLPHSKLVLAGAGANAGLDDCVAAQPPRGVARRNVAQQAHRLSRESA